MGYHLTVEKRVKSNDLKTSDSNSKHNYTETTSGAMTSKNKIDDIVQNIVTNAVPDATLLTNGKFVLISTFSYIDRIAFVSNKKLLKLVPRSVSSSHWEPLLNLPLCLGN